MFEAEKDYRMVKINASLARNGNWRIGNMKIGARACGERGRVPMW